MQVVQKIPRPRILALVRGIIEDAKELVLSQYELRKYQVTREVAKAKTVALWATIGLAFAAIGTVLVILMVVHLLHVLSNVPLWGSYGIIGLLLLAAGGGSLFAAKRHL